MTVHMDSHLDHITTVPSCMLVADGQVEYYKKLSQTPRARSVVIPIILATNKFRAVVGRSCRSPTQRPLLHNMQQRLE